MNQNDQESRFSRATSGHFICKDYPLRNFDNKSVYAYDSLTEGKQEKDKSSFKLYHSWSLDYQANDSDPGYLSLELNGNRISEEQGHSNLVPLKTQQDLKSENVAQPPVPKVILKRSYSSTSNYSSILDTNRPHTKRPRGRPRKHFILNHENLAHKTSFSAGKLKIKRSKRGRPRKSSIERGNHISSTKSKPLQKTNSYPEFFYGEDYNFVTEFTTAELDSYVPVKVQVSTEEKDTLQKQVQLKRSLSVDSARGVGVLSDSKKGVIKRTHKTIKKKEKSVTETAVNCDFSDQKAHVLGNSKINANLNGLEEPACHICAFNRQLNQLGLAGTTSESHQTINIDRCLKWTYKLTKSEWLNSSNSLSLLKSKYPVLKILFKRNPVIHVEHLKQTKLNDSHKISSCMASKFVSSNVNERKSQFVDPRVVSLSKSLVANGKGKVGVEKVFSRAKSKPFKQSKSNISCTVTKSRHDLSFKLKLKEACKPKKKKMEKKSQNTEKAKDLTVHNTSVKHLKKATKHYDTEKVRHKGQGSHVGRMCFHDPGISASNERMNELYSNTSSQSCSPPHSFSSPLGSPGPPHLEKEFMRRVEDGYSDNEMEILKMNDFEIEICRDDDEVLDMRIGVRETDGPEKANISIPENHRNCLAGTEQDKQENPSMVVCSNPTGNVHETEDSISVPDVDLYASRYTNMENLEINVDQASAADVSLYPSPSNLVIQNVCSLNQDYNKTTNYSINETNIYNQRILEMLDGEIFDTNTANMADFQPLDLVKTTKPVSVSAESAVPTVSTKQHGNSYTSDSDETMVYSDISEEALDFSDETWPHATSQNISPRLRLMKSTKRRMRSDATTENDSDSSNSNESGTKDSSQNETQEIIEEIVTDTQDNEDEVFSDKTVSQIQILNKNSTSLEKQTSKTATRHVFDIDRKKKNPENVHHASTKSIIRGNVDTVLIQNQLHLQQSVTNNVHDDTHVHRVDNGTRPEVQCNDAGIDDEENDGCGLVINELISATETVQESSETEAKPSRGGKSPSFARNLAKNKELRDFMNKERERRKTGSKESRQPKSRKSSYEDSEDLPQILPPKRRQRSQKSQNKEEYKDATESAAMERIMADFPKHNWLFNKYNSTGNDNLASSVVNKQADIGQSNTITSGTGFSTCHQANQRAVWKQTVPGNQISDTHKVDSVSSEGVSLTQNTYSIHNKTGHTTYCSSYHNMITTSSVPSSVSSFPVSDVIATSSTSASSFVSPWIPVTDHDPTLASLSLENSPKAFMPFSETGTYEQTFSDRESLSVNTLPLPVAMSQQETVISSAVHVNLVSRVPQGSKTSGAPSNGNGLRSWHNKVNAKRLPFDNAVTTQLNTGQSQINSDRRQLILDRSLVNINRKESDSEGVDVATTKTQLNTEKTTIQGNISMAANKTTISKPFTHNVQRNSVPKTTTSEYQLSALRPETIEAIKRGNPALVMSQFPNLSQKQFQNEGKKDNISMDSKQMIKTVDKLQTVGEKSAIKQDENKSKENGAGNAFQDTESIKDTDHIAQSGSSVVKKDQNMIKHDTCMKENDIGEINNKEPEVNTLNDEGNEIQVINGEPEVHKNIEEENEVHLINDDDDEVDFKESISLKENLDSNRSKKFNFKGDGEESVTADDKLEDSHPLNMSKSSRNHTIEDVHFEKSCSEVEQPEMEVWTAEPLSELISMESSNYDFEEMLLPLDLCVNRNVTENSFASYRKHHPPPVQMVHPQIQKPPSSEMATMTTDMVTMQQGVIEETTKDEDNDESTSQIHESEDNETSSQHACVSNNSDNAGEVDILNHVRTLNDEVNIQEKVSELQSHVPAAALLSTEEVCETQGMTTSSSEVVSSSGPVPTVPGLIRSVPVVSQYGPVVIHPVQQLNPSPRTVTVPAQVFQPVVSLHSITHSAASLQQSQLMNNAPFNTNIIQQPQILTSSHSFHPVQQIRPGQPLNSITQHQSNFGNIQFVIPTGQFFVPVQAPNPSSVMQTNTTPVLQTFVTNAPHSVQNPKPSKRTVKKILPKGNEVPSKKRRTKLEESQVQTASTSIPSTVAMSGISSIYDSSLLIDTKSGPGGTTINASPAIVATECKDSDNKISKTSCTKMDTGIDNTTEADSSFSDGNDDLQKGDSSDELMDEDEELKNEMELYRKLKEERKKKEREEMEMKRKIVEKMKLAKAKKQTSVKLGCNDQKKTEETGAINLDKETVLSPTSTENYLTKEKSSSSPVNNMVENSGDSSNEMKKIDVIAEQKVPQASSHTETFASKSLESTSSDIPKDIHVEQEDHPPVYESSNAEFENLGLDLRLDQHSLKIAKTENGRMEDAANPAYSFMASIPYSASTSCTHLNISLRTDVSCSTQQCQGRGINSKTLNISQDNNLNTGSVSQTASFNQRASESSNNISPYEVKNNREQCMKYKVEGNTECTASVNVLSGSVCSTDTANDSWNLKSGHVLTGVDIEQRPYSPPILTPRPIFGLLNSRILPGSEVPEDFGKPISKSSINTTSPSLDITPISDTDKPKVDETGKVHTDLNTTKTDIVSWESADTIKVIDSHNANIEAETTCDAIITEINLSETNNADVSNANDNETGIVNNSDVTKPRASDENRASMDSNRTDIIRTNFDMTRTSDEDSKMVDMTSASPVSTTAFNMTETTNINRTIDHMTITDDTEEADIDVNRTQLDASNSMSLANKYMTKDSDINRIMNINRDYETNLVDVEESLVSDKKEASDATVVETTEDIKTSYSSANTESKPSLNLCAEMSAAHLDLSTKPNSGTTVKASLNNSLSANLTNSTFSVPCCMSPSMTLNDPVLVESSAVVLPKGHDTVCSTSSSTTGSIMSVGVLTASNSQLNTETIPGSGVIDTTASVTSNSVMHSGSNSSATSNKKFALDTCTTSTYLHVTDDYTKAMDYSSKSLSSINSDVANTGLSPESLSNYKCLNLTRRKPCSDISTSASVIYTNTSTASVTAAYSSYRRLSLSSKEIDSSGHRKVEVYCEIPLAHTKPKLEKIPKGAKPLPAHNNNQIISLKSIIKKMNRTIYQVPSQIQQSGPYFKKALQYNWSPSPKDTYRSKMARRETPLPLRAHNQKPFGIAGKLIVPAGRFIRNASRSGGTKGLAYGHTKAPSTPTDGKPGIDFQQSVSPEDRPECTSYDKRSNQSPGRPILPPVRAHVQLDGNADTVTVTNIQKPSVFLGYAKIPATKAVTSTPNVVDLTGEDKNMFNRDVDLDEAEKQIQQELSKAIAKRQKLDGGPDEVFDQSKALEPGEIKNGNKPSSVTYNEEWEEAAFRKHKRRVRSRSFSFQMNRPVLPTGAYYQPMHNDQNSKHGPPNITLGSQVQQDQPRPYLDIEMGNLRHVLRSSHEDVQAQIQSSGQRHNQVENRVPPLMRMRDARMPPTYNHPGQQEPIVIRSSPDNGYPSQSQSLLRQQGGPSQQLPGLVNHYLVPARQAQRMTQQQFPRLPSKQSYVRPDMMSAQGVGMGPRQRLPQPYPHRMVSGQIQPAEMRYDQGQISSQGNIPRGQVPSPDFQMYSSHGQGSRSHNQDSRHLMPSPQHYQYRSQGQMPSPSAQIRYSPGQTAREYLYSPVKSQGQSSRSYTNVPQGQVPRLSAVQEPTNIMDRYVLHGSGQGQVQGQIAGSSQHSLLPAAHQVVDNGSQTWSHGGPGPQSQRSRYNLTQERLTPVTPPAFPTHTAAYPTMHQYDKPYPVNSGHSAAVYSPLNQQMHTATAGNQGLKNATQNISQAGIQRLQESRNPNLTGNSVAVYVSRNQNLPVNNSGRNNSIQNVVMLENNNFSRKSQVVQDINQYQETIVPVTRQQFSNVNQTLSDYPRNQNVQNQRHVSVRQNSSQQMLNNNSSQFSTHGNAHQLQQQQFGNNPYQQRGRQQGQKLPSNQGHAINQTTINLVSPTPDHHQQLPVSHVPQRNEMTTSSTSDGQSHMNDTVEVIEVEEDDIPLLQQVHGNCVLCGKFSLYLCSVCKNVWYCSSECQISHWQTHSLECQKDGT